MKIKTSPRAMGFIDLKLTMIVAYLDTTREMWDDLKKCYAIAHAPKINQLKMNIADFKQ